MSAPDGTGGLGAPDPQRRVEALVAIAAAAAATPGEIEAMTICLGAAEKIVQRRAAEAFAQLHRAGVAVERPLLLTLRSQELRRRWGAAFALSLIMPLPAEARGVLLESIGLDDGDVRWAAADLLAKMPASDTDGGDVLELLAAGNVNQRKMAAYCLRVRNEPSASSQVALTAALADPSSGVRLAALAALSRLAVDRSSAAPAVAALLDDANPGVRRAAAAALGDLGELRADVLDVLRRAETSDDESLRRAAARSLAKLR